MMQKLAKTYSQVRYIYSRDDLAATKKSLFRANLWLNVGVYPLKRRYGIYWYVTPRLMLLVNTRMDLETRLKSRLKSTTIYTINLLLQFLQKKKRVTVHCLAFFLEFSLSTSSIFLVFLHVIQANNLKEPVHINLRKALSATLGTHLGRWPFTQHLIPTALMPHL